MTSGRPEGAALPRGPAVPATFDEQLVALGADFDRDFYRDAYADVAQGGLDPAVHYLVAGWREGRDPAPWFSTRAYLARRPELAEAGINPFVHYLTVGRRRGAAPAPRDWRKAFRDGLGPVPARIAAARAQQTPSPLSPRAVLAEALAGVEAVHITVSQDDFSTVVGGVQLCIDREAQVLAHARPHLHLYPDIKLPAVSDDVDYAVAVLLDRRRIGTFARADLAVLAEALAPAGRSTLAVHSLLGHHPESLADILAAVRPAQSFFWVHDFAAACDGYTLLRNDTAFCGGPPPGSPVCKGCVYSPLRGRHLDAHDAFLAKLSPTVVAPSATAAEIWTRARGAPAGSVVVHPHAVIVADRPAAPAEGPVNVAFPGLPLPHKGWPAFRAAAEALAGDPRYVFHHFGDAPDLRAKNITFHRVAVSAERPSAMTDALAACQVDLAVIWSIVPETFCLTAHEAVAAGARLAAFVDSGAAAALAAQPDLGVVLGSDAELAAFFADGRAQALAAAGRRPAGRLQLSGMSCDFMGPAHG